MDPLAVTQMARQLGSALAYMHSHGYAHHDVKLENVMIAEDIPLDRYLAVQKQLREVTYKLIDFGICHRYPVSGGLNRVRETVRFCGTPNYISPEKWSKNYNPFKADCYALGMTLYWALEGYPVMESKFLGK